MKEQVGTKLRGIQIAVSEHLVLGASLGANHPRQVEVVVPGQSEAVVALVANGKAGRQRYLGPTGRLA